jgi:ABC-type phosphate transport system substrate-binding protein
MDDWLSADNMVAVLTALLGVGVSFGVVWYERRVPRRKRIGYRVQMDTPIGDDDPDGEGDGAPNVLLGVFNDLPDMNDATLVLLRIENDGGEAISEHDYTNREPDPALTVVFTGRTVRGVAITQSNARHLRSRFGDVRHSGNQIHLPRVPLNRGQYFKLLVVLNRGHVGDPVRIDGDIGDGVIVPNTAVPVDSKSPRFSRSARLITVFLTVCVTVLAGIIIGGEDTPPPMGCATGTLTLIGSTAFAPVLDDLSIRYEKDCPDSAISVDAHGSNEGVRQAAEGPSATIAFSDGAKPDGYPKLTENRVAISAFALVVNDRVKVTNLTVADIRRIYRGDLLNWKQLGGPDLPILLVSRNADSGTRDLFRRHLLAGAGEPAFTSRDCVHKNFPGDRVIRCELDSTDQVLATVARLPGAIGYSELRAATTTDGLHTLRINGRRPSVQAIGDSTYPFTEIEYAYTYGSPSPSSLAASFLNYTLRGAGQDIMQAHGQLPCYKPEGLRRCQT